MKLERKINFQSLAWFWDLFQRQLIDLDPPYQRRSVWNQEYRDFFVDTVLLGYPAPALFLYEEISPDGASRYVVVDGKQRLTTLFDFASNKFPVGPKAEIIALRDKYFKDLPDDAKRSFWKYPFAVEYLPSSDDSLINGIFDRINRNVAKLSPQELRHARFSGEFITVAEDAAEELFKLLPAGFPVMATRSRNQMKDVELVASILLLIEEGPKSYSQDDLDKAFSDRDVVWEKKHETLQTFRSTTAAINDMVRFVLPDNSLLSKTRLRNQTDFYSFCGAIADLIRAGQLPPVAEAAHKARKFIEQVEDEVARANSQDAMAYYEAARSASNDAGPRGIRIQKLKAVLVA